MIWALGSSPRHQAGTAIDCTNALSKYGDDVGLAGKTLRRGNQGMLRQGSEVFVTQLRQYALIVRSQRDTLGLPFAIDREPSTK